MQCKVLFQHFCCFDSYLHIHLFTVPLSFSHLSSYNFLFGFSFGVFFIFLSAFRTENSVDACSNFQFSLVWVHFSFLFSFLVFFCYGQQNLYVPWLYNFQWKSKHRREMFEKKKRRRTETEKTNIYYVHV